MKCYTVVPFTVAFLANFASGQETSIAPSSRFLDHFTLVAAQSAQQAPNLYQFNGQRLHIVYSSGNGKSSLTYQSTSQTLKFSGDQIRITDTEIGTLVTVPIRLTVDTGSTTFTLLLPRVNLNASKQASVEAIGITTIHRFSTIPSFNQGQIENYSTTKLTGTAQFVSSLGSNSQSKGKSGNCGNGGNATAINTGNTGSNGGSINNTAIGGNGCPGGAGINSGGGGGGGGGGSGPR